MPRFDLNDSTKTFLLLIKLISTLSHFAFEVLSIEGSPNMSKKPIITVIGSLNIDFVTLTGRVPGPGETLTAKSLEVHPGGKGANQAVACGKASFKSKDVQDVAVEMVGSVGKGDPYYSSLLKPTLEKSGVGASGVVELEDGQTGTATILVEENGQNRILVVPGANHDGMKDWRRLMEAINASGSPDVVVMQGEIPRSTSLDLLQQFASADTVAILNPAPVFPEGLPPKSLASVDYLIVNETEFLLLASGNDGITANIKNADNMAVNELQSIANSFHSILGVRTLLVTLGAKGVFYSTPSGQQDLIPGVKVSKVVDTTAAGDTFVGYFAAALARHISAQGLSSDFDLAAAMRRANEASAICVQRLGAMQSIPFGYEIP